MSYFYFNSNLPAHEKWRQTYFSGAGLFLKQLIWGLEKKKCLDGLIKIVTNVFQATKHLL